MVGALEGVAHFQPALLTPETKLNTAAFVNVLNKAHASPDPNFVQGLIDGSDDNGDKKLNAEELAAALNISLEDAQTFVATFNTPNDPDQALDKAELIAAFEEIGDQGGGPGGGTGGGGQAGGSQGIGLSGLWALLLGIVDTDGDGKISEEEMQAFIGKYDKNGNGKLDKTELGEALRAEGKGQTVTGADLGKLWSSADKNGDQALDSAELLAALNEGAGTTA